MRRLYFLFPTEAEALAAVHTLNAVNIPKRFMHAHAREGLSLDSLPPASAYQHNDVRSHLARIFWNGDLLVFVLALVGLGLALALGSVVWALVALVLMISTFSAGAFYAMRIPELSLAEFRAALAHGEILLMVDVPKKRLHEIETLVHHKHPAAYCEGSSWTLSVLGI